MIRRMMTVSLLVGAMVSLTACESTSQSRHGGSQPVPILEHHQGSNAAIDGPSVTLITSAEQLEALGASELARQPVDFRNRTLIVIGLGERPTGGYTLRINGVQMEGDNLYIQGMETRPGSDAMVTQAITHPYAAVEVPRLPADRLTLLPEIGEVTASR